MPWIPLHESGIPFQFEPDSGLATLDGSVVTSLGSPSQYSGWVFVMEPGQYQIRMVPVAFNFPGGDSIYFEAWWEAPPAGDYTFINNEAADPESAFEPSPVEFTVGDESNNSYFGIYFGDYSPGINVQWRVEINTPCFWREPLGASQICVEGEGPVATSAEMMADFGSGTDWQYSATLLAAWDTDPEAPFPYDPAEPSYDPDLSINLLDLGGSWSLASVNNCGNAVSAARNPGVSVGTTAAYTTGGCETTTHRHILATVTSPTWPIGAPDPDVILRNNPRGYFSGSQSCSVPGTGLRYLHVGFAIPGMPFEDNIEDGNLNITAGGGSNGAIGSSYVNFGPDWGQKLPVLDGMRFGIEVRKNSGASGTVTFSFTEAVLEVPPPAFTEAKLVLDDYWEFPVDPTPGYDTNDYDYPTAIPVPSGAEVRIMHYGQGAIPFVPAAFRYYHEDVQALADGVYRGRLVLNDSPGTTIATIKVVRGIGP